jgi:hypothetical protein
VTPQPSTAILKKKFENKRTEAHLKHEKSMFDDNSWVSDAVPGSAFHFKESVVSIGLA